MTATMTATVMRRSIWIPPALICASEYRARPRGCKRCETGTPYPLRCQVRPPVGPTFGVVGPGHADGDQDGVAVVADVVAVELAAPLVGCVLDGLAVHTSGVEHMFGNVQVPVRYVMVRRLIRWVPHRAAYAFPWGAMGAPHSSVRSL
jgi:hypothetical protein